MADSSKCQESGNIARDTVKILFVLLVAAAAVGIHKKTGWKPSGKT